MIASKIAYQVRWSQTTGHVRSVSVGNMTSCPHHQSAVPHTLPKPVILALKIEILLALDRLQIFGNLASGISSSFRGLMEFIEPFLMNNNTVQRPVGSE